MNRILQAYPKDIFCFSENFMEVCSKYYGDYFESLKEANSNNVGESLPKASEKTSEKIIGFISENSSITIEKLSQFTGITTRSVECNLKKLQEKNRIRRIGPDRGGHWEVLE